MAYRERSALPSTIRIGPALEITCIEAQDLLGQLIELAQASGRYARVVDRKQEAI
jgi:hypothetical protein